MPPAVLLYGAAGTGKTLLVRAVAAEAGAVLLDLGPRATDGKYMGEGAALMVHMVRAQVLLCSLCLYITNKRFCFGSAGGAWVACSSGLRDAVTRATCALQ